MLLRRQPEVTGTAAAALVGVFQNVLALLRLVGAILMEQDDAWTVADRRYFSAESMRQLMQPLAPTSAQELLIAISRN